MNIWNMTSIEFEKKYESELELQDGGVIINAGKLLTKYNLENRLENLSKLLEFELGSYFKKLVKKAIEIVNSFE